MVEIISHSNTARAESRLRERPRLLLKSAANHIATFTDGLIWKLPCSITDNPYLQVIDDFLMAAVHDGYGCQIFSRKVPQNDASSGDYNMKTMTQPETKTASAAINTLLTAKVAAMSPAQADERCLEIYAAPDSPENQLELIKLLFGADMSVGE